MAKKLNELFNKMRSDKAESANNETEDVYDLVKILNKLQTKKKSDNPFEPTGKDAPSSMEYDQNYIDQLNSEDEFEDDMFAADYEEGDDFGEHDEPYDDLADMADDNDDSMGSENPAEDIDFNGEDSMSGEGGLDDSDPMSDDEESIYELLKSLTDDPDITSVIDDIEQNSMFAPGEGEEGMSTLGADPEPDTQQVEPSYSEQEEDSLDMELGDGQDMQGEEPDMEGDQDMQDPEGMEGDDPENLDDMGEEGDDPNKQGSIRNVKGAHLVYKRKEEDGTYSELWIYNITNANDKKSGSVRDNILAGTDIDPTDVDAREGDQAYKIWTAGNAQLLVITGLPQ